MQRVVVLVLLFFTSLPVLGNDDPRSVYEVTPARDLSLTGVGLLGTALPYLFENQWIRHRCPCNPGEVPGFDRGAIGNNSSGALVMTDVVATLSMVAPPFLNYLDLGWNSVFAEDLLVYAQTLATSAALVSIVKAIAQRPVPRSYAGDPTSMNTASGYRSFYSGHVTMTVTALSAAAFTMNLRYQNGVWPWLIVGTLGSAVAVGRVLGGVHFPSDVLVGAAVGVGIGTLLPLLHARPRNTSSIVFLSPLEGGAKLLFLKRL